MDITTQIFLYGLALGVVTLSITIFYLLNLYKDAVKKLSEVKTGEEVKINQYVEKKAQTIIDTLSESTKERFQNELADVVKNTKTNLNQKIEELIDEMKNQMSSQVSGTDKLVEEKISGIEEGARKMIEQKYSQIEKGLLTYKDQKTAEINAKVKELLPKVLEGVITKSLSSSQQEELILNILEDAKRQNLL